MWRAIVLLCLAVLARGQSGTEEQAAQWALVYNTQAEFIWSLAIEAEWTYNTNLTDHNMNIMLEQETAAAAFDKASALTARTYDWENFNNQLLKRQFSKIIDIGPAILPEDKYREMSTLTNEMTRIYSIAEVCNKPGDTSGNCYPLEPDLTQIIASPDSDWATLLWAWQGWRDESGRKMPEMYEEFVGFLNEAALMNGYSDNGAYWRSWYESDTFRQDVENLWVELRPLYEELHAYVLRKLKEKFPDGEFPAGGHIPAHLLGNMWAQTWEALEPLVRPFPEKAGLDVTEEMNRQGYTVLKLFELSEEFFISLGLMPTPDTFWEKTMMIKPTDRDVVCHASAWDFYNRFDYRIKQCTEVTQNWLMTTHHEMGHIQYFLQYARHPVNFREGANPGFHEAVGDVMSLSVSTPEHLAEIGLLPDFVDDPEVDLNFLMIQALQKIAFLPFGYLIDQWRWNVFEGITSRAEYNERWWEFRCRYQGVSPPVVRTSSDFDPGAKYHIPANTPYIRYFVSFVLQFHFHQALCEASGNMKPLHRCDIYRSEAAGEKFSAMLSTGSSMPWPDAMEMITGVREMSVRPLLDYFRPLHVWLEEQNVGHPKGWTLTCPPGTVVP